MKKKGFTLIELLAVIVILAIIALIATPIVLNLINKAREGAAKASATSYIKAVETYMITSELDGGSGNLESGETYSVSELNDLVELKGTKPDSGSIEIDDKRNVTSASLAISGYLIEYDGNDYTVAGRSNDVYAESIEITKTDDTVMKGETLQLTANITPNSVTNKTITWKSSDEKIATVDGTGKVTGQGLGTAKITAKTVNGKSASVEIKVNDYLASVVKEGDYVAYDAGAWAETKGRPTQQGDFGGYENGTSKNKNASVGCYTYNEHMVPSLQGWRVLSKDEKAKTVTIVHAGEPECYYHAFGNSSESLKALDERAQSTYVNKYAQSARSMKKEDTDAITPENNTLRATGGVYWLATEGPTSGDLYRIISSGSYSTGSFSSSMGFRPVVELKANIITTGQEPDTVGNKNAWTLVGLN